MSFVLEKLASLDVLQGMRTQPDKANLVESLSIRPKSHLAPVRAGRYVPILADALTYLTSLTTLAIPFALLSEEVFDFVYNHPTIKTLELVEVSKDNAAHSVPLDSTVVRPTRPAPLSVPVLFLDYDDHDFTESFLCFLDRHSIRFPRIEFGVGDPMPDFLTWTTFPSINNLLILALPDEFQSAFDFVPEVADAQPNLGWIDLNFIGADDDSFELGDAWPVWQFPGLAPYGSMSGGKAFADAWRGIPLSEARMASARICAEYPWRAEDVDQDEDERDVVCVRLDFSAGAVVTAAAIQTLAIELYWTGAVVFAGPVGWRDWDAIVKTLIDRDLFILDHLSFQCSLTPTPTVSTTLACSSDCYAKLARRLPSLVIDADLVGGYLAVWDIAYHVNLSRLKMTAEIVSGGNGEVDWVVGGKSQVVLVVKPEGTGDDHLDWERDEYALVPTSDKIKDCFCFGCGEVKVDDPVTALKKCPVVEVRDALKTIDFDLDAFDARAPSEPINPTSLETFLRSSA